MDQEQIPDAGTTTLLAEFNTKLRDIEERQRLIKDRVLLIGENLVDGREDSIQEISELKVKTENLEQEIKRIKDTLSSIIEEMGNFARKAELEILKKQFKMFQPFIDKTKGS